MSETMPKKYPISINGREYGYIAITETGRLTVVVGPFSKLYAPDDDLETIFRDISAAKVLNECSEDEFKDVWNRIKIVYIQAIGDVNLANPVLQSPLDPGEDPLHVLLEPLRRVVIMEPAVEQILYAALSAYTLNPLNVEVLKKNTAEGGTYTLLSTLQIFPPGDIIKLDYATPTSFFHEHIEGWVMRDTNEDVTEKIEQLKDEIVELEKSLKTRQDKQRAGFDLEDKKKELRDLMKQVVGIINLWHKIIVFTEPPSAELFSKIKPLLSHDAPYVEASYTDKSAFGGMTTVHVRLVGWPAVFTVFSEDETSQAKLGLITQAQLSSRFVKIEINTSPIKFQGVIKRIAIDHAKFEEDANLEVKMQKAAKFIAYLRNKLIGISAPYIFDIENNKNFIKEKNFGINFFALSMATGFKARIGEDMRAFQYLLSLIEIRAFVYIDYRLKIQNSRVKIVVSKEDVEAILEKFGTQVVAHIPKTKKLEYEILKEVLKNGAKTADEIYNTHLFKYTSPYSLRTHLLSILERYGYLTSSLDPTDTQRRRLQYGINDSATFGSIAPPAGVQLGAIGAIAKKDLMKWFSAGARSIAPDGSVYDSKISDSQLDSLINNFVLCQSGGFGAIEPLNTKQSIAPIAPDCTKGTGAIDHDQLPLVPDNSPQDITEPAKTIDSYAAEQSLNPEERQLKEFEVLIKEINGKQTTLYMCKACNKLFMSLADAKAHLEVHKA